MKRIALGDLSSPNVKVKYACAKRAIALSKDDPDALYPDLDVFKALLDSPNEILKWTAIQVIGNLSKVDKKAKVDRLLPRIIGYLRAGKLITANNAILALSEIAANKPKHAKRIARELLKVVDYRFETAECRNIVIGKALLAFDRLKDDLKSKDEIRSFAQRQAKNPRNATREKARRLLKKLGQAES